jgi:hypothetical protein
VMLRTCGDPEQAPTVMTAASAAATFQRTERVLLGIAISLPCRERRCEAFARVGVNKIASNGAMAWNARTPE